MKKRVLPAADDVVEARRKEGYGTVDTPHGLWPEGGVIPMRFLEAIDREDCEALGYEGTTIADLQPELEAAEAESVTDDAPGEG